MFKPWLSILNIWLLGPAGVFGLRYFGVVAYGATFVVGTPEVVTVGFVFCPFTCLLDTCLGGTVYFILFPFVFPRYVPAFLAASAPLPLHKAVINAAVPNAVPKIPNIVGNSSFVLCVAIGLA